jgi:carbonic anhydrase
MLVSGECESEIPSAWLARSLKFVRIQYNLRGVGVLSHVDIRNAHCPAQFEQLQRVQQHGYRLNYRSASARLNRSPTMPIIGTQQSPIKIEAAKTIHASFGQDYLAFNYSRPLTGSVDHAKHNFVFDPPPNENAAAEWSIVVGGVTWLIRQIHMHAPAEHLVDSDEAKPFETHLVHSAVGDVRASGAKLVVGVFIRPGSMPRAKPSLKGFADSLQKSMDANRAEPTAINPSDFLPDTGLDRFFRYEGSLTGPPYSEDVSWHVMADYGVIEKPIFDALAAYAGHHAREVQFLNRRFILRSFA